MTAKHRAAKTMTDNFFILHPGWHLTTYTNANLKILFLAPQPVLRPSSSMISLALGRAVLDLDEVSGCGASAREQRREVVATCPSKHRDAWNRCRTLSRAEVMERHFPGGMAVIANTDPVAPEFPEFRLLERLGCLRLQQAPIRDALSLGAPGRYGAIFTVDFFQSLMSGPRTAHQRQNNASRMMMGSGMPISHNNAPLPSPMVISFVSSG
jgi:hypothetical protein